MGVFRNMYCYKLVHFVEDVIGWPSAVTAVQLWLLDGSTGMLSVGSTNINFIELKLGSLLKLSQY